MASKRLVAQLAGSRVRIALVGALAAFSLATAVPNYLYILFPIYGHFGFVTDSSGRVEWTNRRGLIVGDVIDWHAMPFSQHYDVGDYSRWALVGTRVDFRVIRNGVQLSVPLVSEYHIERFGGRNGLWLFGVKKGSELVIVLLGAALVLIRPTRPSWLFFLYVSGLAADLPMFWSFLPSGLFAALSFIAGIIAWPLPPTALMLFAVMAFGEPSSRWRSTVERLAPWLFVLSAALITASIARDQFAFTSGAWLPTASTACLALVWTASFAILAVGAASAFRANNRPAGWVCTALAASALCYVYINAGSLAVPDLVPSPNLWATVSLLLSLAAIYTIARGRIIDVRFVITRAALSAIIGCCIVGAFALLNLALASQIARVAYIVPLEILIASLLGFRLSGLQDLAAAQDLVNRVAPVARLRGDRSVERDTLARALARAERSRNRRLIAEVRAHAAFAAWFAGDDQEFVNHGRALEQIASEKPVPELGRFATCLRTQVSDHVLPGEFPEWSAMAELVGCGKSDDAVDARLRATRASKAAEISGDSFLQVLAYLALAEFDVAERTRLHGLARECCNSIGALKLTQAVHAVSAGRQQVEFLDAFINKRLRAPRAKRATLDVRFADASVFAYGEPKEIRPRELALLFEIAKTPEGVSFEELSDRLWPDLDGDAVRNVLNVTLHRLRKALGDVAAISRTRSRYRLRDGTLVDLWRMRSLINDVDASQSLDEETRERLADVVITLRLGRGGRPVGRESFLEMERRIARLRRDASCLLVEDALERHDLRRAMAVASELVEDDPIDEIARALNVRVQLEFSKGLASEGAAGPRP